MRPRIAFAAGAFALVAFELANAYFVLPMPGSQRIDSLDVAYALHRWRWAIRAACGTLLLAGLADAWRAGARWRMAAALATTSAAAVAYLANVVFAADRVFEQPKTLILRTAAENQVPSDRLVVGIEVGGEARAYPIQFIGYHHQVRDRVGGEEVLVTYCTVCRTGRVFSPVVEGKAEDFRLVGMDRFNAMLEDESTGSWWRQATGRAVAGPRKGTRLVVIPSLQVTVREWLALHPRSLVMQADPAFAERYPKDDAFEKGTSRKTHTGTNPESWQDKSWVVGIEVGGRSKAYDWNRLRRERVIHDAVGATPIVLVLAADEASFYAFERPDAETRFALEGETLVGAQGRFGLSGTGPGGTLRRVQASQEFWHSWRTFHPETERY
jgi:hypothetical protein